MIPIAVAYLAVFVVAAIVWRSVALGVGSAAIVVYLAALGGARVSLARGEVERAALLTGGGLLAMIGIAVFAVHFQYPAFALIAIAAVVVVLPHVERRVLWWFAGTAIAAVVIVTTVGALPPAFEQPPLWFREIVLLSSLFAASCLIILMLAADHRRMRGLVRESTELAGVAQRQRDATDAFLIAASHQFRTPVSTLLLQSESLLRGAPDDASKRRLERLMRSADRLHLLVDTMLDVSRITSGSLQLERTVVDVAALVRAVAATQQAGHASDARVEVLIVDDGGESAEELHVEADARRLELMTSHLIENAVRLGKGAPARIEVRRDARDVLIAITDGGKLLDVSTRERIFDREALQSPQAEHDGGPAVGLWLVRELSRAMGGEVSANEGANGGTRFEVRLPRRVV
ncbi:MAG TPA: HAMP domain-containing sensor histidine kinase [Kofleriaceae bacterium]|nr:HAMP domain-containing sensor histidine kinase [Kofleriaceae bacterium]